MERLTKKAGWHKDIDLTQELGYSYIYQRLSELENKIEEGTLKEIHDNLIGEIVYGIQRDITGKYIFDGASNTLIGFTSNGIVTWNDVYSYNDYFTDGFWFFTSEEAEKKLAELKGEL